jgi:hypothetical protein
MQKSSQNKLSPTDRRAIATSFLATIACFAAIVVVCVVLSLTRARKDASSIALSGASPDARTSMLLVP